MEKKRPQKSNKKKQPRLAVDMDSARFISSNEPIFCRIRRKAKLVSVEAFTGNPQAKDKDVYQAANVKDYHILTANDKDFKNFPGGNSKKVGVISYPQTGLDDALPKIEELLTNEGHEGLYGKSLFVTKSKITERSKKKKRSN